MLLIYRKSDGMVMNGPNTNFRYPEGPPYEAELENVLQIHGGTEADYRAHRLHDENDGGLVAEIFEAGSAQVILEEGKVIGVKPVAIERTMPEPELEAPSVEERISDLEEALALLHMEVTKVATSGTP